MGRGGRRAGARAAPRGVLEPGLLARPTVGAQQRVRAVERESRSRWTAGHAGATRRRRAGASARPRPRLEWLAVTWPQARGPVPSAYLSRSRARETWAPTPLDVRITLGPGRGRLRAPNAYLCPRVEHTERVPELSALPRGLLLDRELVAFNENRTAMAPSSSSECFTATPRSR